MLMDMFYHAAPGPRKRRVHLAMFMSEVYQRLHKISGVLQPLWRGLLCCHCCYVSLVEEPHSGGLLTVLKPLKCFGHFLQWSLPTIDMGQYRAGSMYSTICAVMRNTGVPATASGWVTPSGLPGFRRSKPEQHSRGKKG